eukprot:gene8697-8878_t
MAAKAAHVFTQPTVYSIPVYLGHYHFPHTVNNTSITYIGSPYQVSFSEAGQQKRLLLLDDHWKMSGQVPLDIGRRFHSFNFLLPGAGGGSSDSESCLNVEWVQVQLQLLPAAAPVARIQAAEQLSISQLLEQYAANTGMREEGFGPFRTLVEYPLDNRGVVAVTGRNEDDIATVSNGAGKTSLLTALLWAFKAPDGRGMTNADYINEDSRRAEVTVRGVINKEPFELTRSTTKSKSTLSLTINGVDVTLQEQRLTQEVLETQFSASLLPKTLVFTQEDLLALLQVKHWRQVITAFGRTGIPSFVLEEVLGELQAATSRHLSELAVVAARGRLTSNVLVLDESKIRRCSVRAHSYSYEGRGDNLASEFAAHLNQLSLKAPLQHRRPSPLDPPTAAVAAQLDALQINDWPETDAGVLTALAFAKPYECEQLLTAVPTPVYGETLEGLL